MLVPVTVLLALPDDIFTVPTTDAEATVAKRTSPAVARAVVDPPKRDILLPLVSMNLVNERNSALFI
jgi:hypothetical protein